mmetsp:Transcript_21206/g.37724  ORF Transcript_21206/g.37724 Transcript_21206/m.37724 type:complete len:407 (-) Transcript_21206:259-1479(-)
MTTSRSCHQSRKSKEWQWKKMDEAQNLNEQNVKQTRSEQETPTMHLWFYDFIKDTHLNLKNRWAHKPTMINPDAIKGNFQALCEKFTIRTQTKPKVVKDYCRTTNSPSNVLRALTSHEFFTAEEAKEVHYQLEKAHPAMAVAANGLGNDYLAITMFLDDPEITSHDIHRGANETFEALGFPIRIEQVTKNMSHADYVTNKGHPLGKTVTMYLEASTETETRFAEVWIRQLTEEYTGKDKKKLAIQLDGKPLFKSRVETPYQAISWEEVKKLVETHKCKEKTRSIHWRPPPTLWYKYKREFEDEYTQEELEQMRPGGRKKPTRTKAPEPNKKTEIDLTEEQKPKKAEKRNEKNKKKKKKMNLLDAKDKEYEKAIKRLRQKQRKIRKERRKVELQEKKKKKKKKSKKN